MIGWNFSLPMKNLHVFFCRKDIATDPGRLSIFTPGWRFFTLFVINPLRSARPTSLLWRLSVSETGIVDRPDQSSYHTLRQIAHGLFGGGGSGPLLGFNTFSNQIHINRRCFSYKPTYMLCPFENRENIIDEWWEKGHFLEFWILMPAVTTCNQNILYAAIAAYPNA